jgi:HD-GYP domain-containing protein (c-di-GMP phosphodiesterase class II)
MYRNINLTIASRLFSAWVVLSLLLGSAVYLLERDKIGDYVRDLALTESAEFSNSVADLIALGVDEDTRQKLQDKANALIAQHFSVVEIYDIEGEHLVVAARAGSEEVEVEAEMRRHVFPQEGSVHYETFQVQGQLFAFVLVPLRTTQGALAGYFDGAYGVPQTALAKIRERIYRTLGLVLASVLACSVALYPLILTLNRTIMRYSNDLLEANIQLLEVLGSAVATRDTTTHSHNYRVTIYAVRLGEALRLADPQIRDLMVGSFLHDVGKIGISDGILRKPAALDAQERNIMQQHVILGLRIVDNAKWTRAARDVIHSHHERFDGTGYPRGLAGAQIPLGGRIFAVVDVFDALTSERPYKQAYDFATAMKMLEEQRGRHFDPHIVETFTGIAGEIYATVSGASEEQLNATLSAFEHRYFLAATTRAG